MRDTYHEEGHDVLENPSPNVESCFKQSEEMKFDQPSFRAHEYCEDIKRGIAFNSDDFTFVKTGSFGYTDC